MPSAPQKVHFFYLPPVRFTRFHYIYPRRIDACMPQYIRKMGYVFIYRVKAPCKQMPKVMRKDLFPRDSGKGAQPFHIRPYIAPVKRFSAFCYEYASASYFPFPYISLQYPAQLTWQNNYSYLSLAAYTRLPCAYRLNRYVFKL